MHICICTIELLWSQTNISMLDCNFLCVRKENWTWLSMIVILDNQNLSGISKCAPFVIFINKSNKIVCLIVFLFFLFEKKKLFLQFHWIAVTINLVSFSVSVKEHCTGIAWRPGTRLSVSRKCVQAFQTTCPSAESN